MKNATHVSCLLSSSRFVRSPGVNTACINRVPSGTGCKSLSLPRTVAGDYINFNYRANVASRRFRSAFCYCGMTRASFRFFPHQSGKKKKKKWFGTPCQVPRFCVLHLQFLCEERSRSKVSRSRSNLNLWVNTRRSELKLLNLDEAEKQKQARIQKIFEQRESEREREILYS